MKKMLKKLTTTLAGLDSELMILFPFAIMVLSAIIFIVNN